MLALGAGLIGLECWGVWEYMQFKGAPMYLACLGILVAISAPSLGLIRGPMQWVALLVAPIAMAAVLTTAMARMASVADVSLQAHAKATRQNALAEAAVRDFVQTLDEAREAVRLACSSAITKKCTEAQLARNTAQENLNRARQAVVDVPVVAGDPAAQMLSDATLGLISPERASTIVALSIPVIGSVLSWLLFAAWRTWPGQPEAPTVEQPEEGPFPRLRLRWPSRREAMPATTSPAEGFSAAEALMRLQITGGRSKLELGKVRRLYIDECKRRQARPVAGDTFVDDVANWCKAYGVELQGDNRRVYMLGVKLPV